MRIAFAINGEGRGHVSRIKAIAETLCGRYEYTFYAPEHLRNELTRNTHKRFRANPLPLV
jgi:UDP:flavonoid glycosyltransferase YjiC (YdhE family)